MERYKEVQYFCGSSFLYIFMLTEIKTILNGTCLQRFSLLVKQINIIIPSPSTCCSQPSVIEPLLLPFIICFFQFFVTKLGQHFRSSENYVRMLRTNLYQVIDNRLFRLDC